MPPVVLFLAVAVFAQGTSEFMLAGLLPDIATDLAISVPRAGLLTSAFAVGMVIGAPLMAVAGRNRSPRWTLSMFLSGFIAAHVVGALTDGFGLLLATRVVAALCNAGFLAVTLSTVSTLVPVDRSARALAVILGGTTLALVAGVPGGAAVGALLGWRAALWGVAVISVPALIAVVLSVPRRPETASMLTRSLRHEYAVLCGRPAAPALALGALVNGATFCAFTYLAPLATDRAGLPAAALPLLLAVFGIGASLGVGVAGRLADRRSTAVLTVGISALCAGWIAFLVLADTPVAVYALAFAQGGLAFAVGGTLVTQVMSRAADAPTLSGAAATASLNIGAALGPVLGGIAYVTAAGSSGPLVVSAALVLVAGVLLVLVRRGDGRGGPIRSSPQLQ